MKLFLTILSRRKITNYRSKLRYKIQSLRYTNPQSPYKRIYLDPYEVDGFVDSPELNKGMGMIGDENFEDISKPFEDHPVHEGLYQRFKQEMDWTETTYYRFVSNKIQQRGRFRGYYSVGEFKKNRLDYVDQLYENMCENGYVSDTEHDAPGEEDTQKPHRSLDPIIVIDKDGDYYLRDGFHRFTISKIIGISEIPVNVVKRHKLWQKKLDNIKLERGVSIKHPDTEDMELNN